MPSVAVYTADRAERTRLEHLIGTQADIRFAGSADNPATLTRLLAESAAEVIVADAASLPESFAFGQGAALIVLIDAAASESGIDALALGAAAVLPRSASGSELALAIAAAARGLSLLPRSLLDTLAATAAPEIAAGGEVEEAGAALTPREVQVLTAIADGASNKLIARRLGISFHTVKFHVASILAKLDADSRAEAVAEAARRGLIML